MAVLVSAAKSKTTENTEDTEKTNLSAAGTQPNRDGGAGLSGKRQTTEFTENTEKHGEETQQRAQRTRRRSSGCRVVLGEGWRCAPKGRWRKGRPGRQECQPQARKPAPQGGLPQKQSRSYTRGLHHRRKEKTSQANHRHKAAGVARKAACSTEGAADGVWKDRAVGMCVALPARPPAWQAWRLAPQDFPVWHARLRAPRRGRCGRPGGMLHLGAGYSREAAVRMASATEAAARM